MALPIKMAESVELGVPGLSVPRGTHMCAFFREQEERVPRYPLVLLCLYDLDQLRGDLFVDILRSHPKVLLGSTVLENLYYVPPDELAATR
jgi:hypothetical protein